MPARRACPSRVALGRPLPAQRHTGTRGADGADVDFKRFPECRVRQRATFRIGQVGGELLTRGPTAGAGGGGGGRAGGGAGGGGGGGGGWGGGRVAGGRAVRRSCRAVVSAAGGTP